MGLGRAGQVGAPPGAVRLQERGRPTPTPPAAPSFCLLHFLASQRALLLLFGDGTLQVSARGALVPRGPLLGQPHAPGPRGCSSTLCWGAQKRLALVGVGLVTPRYRNGKIQCVRKHWQSALWAILVATRSDRPNVISVENHF